MVAQLLGFKDIDNNFSRRSSTYVDPESDRIFDIPVAAYSLENRTVKCVECFQIPGKVVCLLNNYT